MKGKGKGKRKRTRTMARKRKRKRERKIASLRKTNGWETRDETQDTILVDSNKSAAPV